MHSSSFLGTLVNSVDPDQMIQKVKKITGIVAHLQFEFKIDLFKGTCGTLENSVDPDPRAAEGGV